MNLLLLPYLSVLLLLPFDSCSSPELNGETVEKGVEQQKNEANNIQLVVANVANSGDCMFLAIVRFLHANNADMDAQNLEQMALRHMAVQDEIKRIEKADLDELSLLNLQIEWPKTGVHMDPSALREGLVVDAERARRSLLAYAKNMQRPARGRPTRWGTGLELHHVAEVLQRPIVVMYPRMRRNEEHPHIWEDAPGQFSAHILVPSERQVPDQKENISLFTSAEELFSEYIFGRKSTDFPDLREAIVLRQENGNHFRTHFPVNVPSDLGTANAQSLRTINDYILSVGGAPVEEQRKSPSPEHSPPKQMNWASVLMENIDAQKMVKRPEEEIQGNGKEKKVRELAEPEEPTKVSAVERLMKKNLFELGHQYSPLTHHLEKAPPSLQRMSKKDANYVPLNAKN